MEALPERGLDGPIATLPWSSGSSTGLGGARPESPFLVSPAVGGGGGGGGGGGIFSSGAHLSFGHDDLSSYDGLEDFVDVSPTNSIGSGGKHHKGSSGRQKRKKEKAGAGSGGAP